MPTRFEDELTRHGSEQSVSSAAAVNQSSRGPSRTRSTGSSGRPNPGTVPGGAGCASAGSKPIRSAVACPKRRRPEAGQEVGRAAAERRLDVDPAAHADVRAHTAHAPSDLEHFDGTNFVASSRRSARSSSDRRSAAPARRASPRAPPRRAGSRPAGCRARSATGSAAPDGGTPRCASPGRPRSCTVVSSPGLTTSIRVMPRRTGRGRRARAAPAARAPGRTSRSSSTRAAASRPASRADRRPSTGRRSRRCHRARRVRGTSRRGTCSSSSPPVR